MPLAKMPLPRALSLSLLHLSHAIPEAAGTATLCNPLHEACPNTDITWTLPHPSYLLGKTYRSSVKRRKQTGVEPAMVHYHLYDVWGHF